MANKAELDQLLQNIVPLSIECRNFSKSLMLNKQYTILCDKFSIFLGTDRSTRHHLVTIMILGFQTDKSGQIVRTASEVDLTTSDQVLHCAFFGHISVWVRPGSSVGCASAWHADGHGSGNILLS